MKDPIQRILENTIVGDTGWLSSCWLSQAVHNGNGYVGVSLGRRGEGRAYAHRLMYERFHGPIGEGLQVDHLCGIRHCVNPGHLDLVTNRENFLRSAHPNAERHLNDHCKRGHSLAGRPTNKRGVRWCAECRKRSG